MTHVTRVGLPPVFSMVVCSWSTTRRVCWRLASAVLTQVRPIINQENPPEAFIDIQVNYNVKIRVK